MDLDRLEISTWEVIGAGLPQVEMIGANDLCLGTCDIVAYIVPGTLSARSRSTCARCDVRSDIRPRAVPRLRQSLYASDGAIATSLPGVLEKHAGVQIWRMLS